MTIFADDTSIRCTNDNVTTTKQHIQQHLNILQQYYNKWKIRVNPQKSESIIFTRKRKLEDTPTHLLLDGEQIRPVTSIKYLGITIQNNLKFNTHCSNIIKQANGVLHKLWPLFGYDSRLNEVNKLTIYKLYIRPVLTYNIVIWNDLCKTNKKKLQSLQNKCLRIALNLKPNPMNFKQVKNEIIHDITRTQTIKEFTNKLSGNFVANCENHMNPIIRSLFPLHQN